MTQNSLPDIDADAAGHGAKLGAPPIQRPALPDFEREVYCILGLPFDRVGLLDACAILRRASAHRQRCFLSTPNLNFAVACMDDPSFRNSVIQSDLSIADGMPLVWIARAMGLPIKERVAGSSLFQVLREGSDRTSAPVTSVFFFGGPPGVAQAAAEKLGTAGGAMRAAGFASPGFGSIEQMSDAATLASINDSGADFLVVALGAKKGQAWIQHNLPALHVPLVSHLGAVVNFVAGTVSRAPAWAQKTGLEWAWRIKEEPQLWRRYRDDGLALLRLVTTRVIPGMLARRQRVPAELFAQASMAVRVESGEVELVLEGAVGEPNIGAFRQALHQAAQAGGPLVIDCARLHHIDSAALASLMLLYGACVAARRPWAVINPQPSLRRQFELHCAQYMLQPLA